MVLCACSEKVNTKAIPLDVVPLSGGEPWTLMGIGREASFVTSGRLLCSEERAESADGVPHETLPATSAESLL